MPAAELEQVRAKLGQLMASYALTPEVLSERFLVLADEEAVRQRLITVQGPAHQVAVRL